VDRFRARFLPPPVVGIVFGGCDMIVVVVFEDLLEGVVAVPVVVAGVVVVVAVLTDDFNFDLTVCLILHWPVWLIGLCVKGDADAAAADDDDDDGY